MARRRETPEQEAFRRQLVYNSVHDSTFRNAQADVLRQLSGVPRDEANRLVRGANTPDGHRELVRTLSRNPDPTPMQRQINRTVGFGGANPTPRERAERLASAVSMLYDVRQPSSKGVSRSSSRNG